jgi:DNA-binding MarR family transcriptional regulator
MRNMADRDDELPGGGLGYALMTAANAWRAELGDVLASRQITPAQFFVLAALLHLSGRGRPAPMQRDLAERTGIDPNTMSQVVRALERRGVIARGPHPDDSRAVALSLTREGLPLARECAARARDLNRRYFAGVDARPLYELLTGLADRSRERHA